MPKINGLTSGFLKTDCKTEPDTARLEPTRETNITLGNLTLFKINSCSWDHKTLVVNPNFEYIQFAMILMSISYFPCEKEIKLITINVINIMAVIIFC